jgi:glycosyltransferase involved in cell wall biosynthesis
MLHDTVVSVSQEADDSLKEIYNLKKDPKVIINIQNFERLKPLAEEKIKTKFDKNYINLVSVGRLEEQKAYLRYVDIHKKLIEDGYKIRFYLVGDGSEYSLIEDKVKKLNIEDSFVMLGFHSNPFPYVKNADIFVLPSLFEGMPTVVFESLYLKTPVISAKVAGIDYLLGSKKYGIITENSKEGIYEGIKSILDNPKLIDTFRTNLEKYDIDDNKSYNEIYDLINK